MRRMRAIGLALFLCVPWQIASAEKAPGGRAEVDSVDRPAPGRTMSCDPPPRLRVEVVSTEVTAQRTYAFQVKATIPCPAEKRLQVNLVTEPNPILGLPDRASTVVLYIEVGQQQTPQVSKAGKKHWEDAEIEFWAWAPAVSGLVSRHVVVDLPNPNPQVKGGEPKQVKPQLQQQVH